MRKKMEITFRDVNPSDQITIKKQKSEYRFSVVNPGERRGVLTGGSLGSAHRDAVLIGSLTNEENSLASDPSALKTGSRALFYLTARNGVERLITSIITGLARNQSDSGRRAA